MDKMYRLEMEIETMKIQLRTKERELDRMKKQLCGPDFGFRRPTFSNLFEHLGNNTTKLGCLPKWAIERYSRQILLPEIGMYGQEKLCLAKVLLVGAGGLGCPAAAYLAGAGVGEIGIMDPDTVDLSNIHRQILHEEVDQQTNKAYSIINSLKKLNSRIRVSADTRRLCPLTAPDVMGKYDVVLDCTDNIVSRYLLGDMCAKLKKPLVSGSALKMEGQLSVYSYRAEKNDKEKDPTLVGPCYRCVFPVPPSPDTVGTCSAHGVIGPVPGMIGCLQALETIKLIAGMTHDKLLVGRMMIFDGEDCTARTVKLRPRNPQCKACSADEQLEELLDFDTFCSARAEEEGQNQDVQLLPLSSRVTPPQLIDKLRSLNWPPEARDQLCQRHLLVDVRSADEHRMCYIDGSVNYPLDDLYGGTLDSLLARIKDCSDEVTFFCRRGNDSQIAVLRVLEVLEEEHARKVKDLVGGLHAWADQVDSSFPIY